MPGRCAWCGRLADSEVTLTTAEPLPGFRCARIVPACAEHAQAQRERGYGAPLRRHCRATQQLGLLDDGPDSAITAG